MSIFTIYGLFSAAHRIHHYLSATRHYCAILLLLYADDIILAGNNLHFKVTLQYLFESYSENMSNIDLLATASLLTLVGIMVLHLCIAMLLEVKYSIKLLK